MSPFAGEGLGVGVDVDVGVGVGDSVGFGCPPATPPTSPKKKIIMATIIKTANRVEKIDVITRFFRKKERVFPATCCMVACASPPGCEFTLSVGFIKL